MEFLIPILVVIGIAAFIFFVLPLLFKLKKGYLEKRLLKYEVLRGI